MSSPDTSHIVSERSHFPAWGTLILGSALIIFAGFLAWWGFTNWPKTNKATGKVAPVNQRAVFPSSMIAVVGSPLPGSSQSEPQATPAPTPSTSKPSNKLPRKSFQSIKRLPADSTKKLVLNETPSNAASRPETNPTPDAALSIPTPSPQPLSSPTSVPSVIPQTEAAPAKSPTTAVSPSPNVNSPEVRKPNVVRRILNGFVHLFNKIFKRKKAARPVNQPPQVVSVLASSSEIRRPCPPGTRSDSCTPTGSEETVFASASDPDNDQLLYTWSVTGGRLSGEGRQVTWDLSGVANGTYTATVEVNDGNQHTANGSATVIVTECTACFRPPPPCPTVSASCPSELGANAPITFTASVSGVLPGDNYVYNWSVSAGTITNGQGTSMLTVDTKGLGGQSVTATVSLGGGDPSCTGTTSSCTTGIRGEATIPIAIRLRRGNAAVNGGRVTFFNDSNGKEYASDFGQDGLLRISLPAGSYRIVASFSSRPQQVTVSSDDADKVFTIIFPDDGPTSTPTPNDNPNNDGPDPEPSPTASLSPAPTATPQTVKIVKESDRITAQFRESFLRDVDNKVTVNLERVVETIEQLVTVDANTQTVTVTDKPKGLNGDLITPKNSGLYDTYVTIKLTGEGLIIPPDQVSQTKLYSKANQDPRDKLKQTWTWDVRPANGLLKTELNFEMFVIWQPTNGERANEPVKVWNFTRLVPVGKSGLLVYGSTVTSPFVLFAGAGLISKGSRKRKRTSDTKGDEVVSSVYAPREVRPGDSFLIDLFLQLSDDLSDVAEKMAKMGDEASTLRDMSPLANRIAAGTTLTFCLTLPGMEIQDSEQSGTWQSKLLRVRFNVSVPRNFEPAKVIATVVIAAESVPIGHLSFTLNVVGPTAVPSKEEVLKVKVRAYKQAFISYASIDRAEVTKRTQMLKLLKVSFFQDLLELEPGDQFEPVIYEYINRSDVFLLFWSKAASESEWVEKEVLYAIKRKTENQEALPEIIPVIIEGPPPAKPPNSLSFIHFNDKMIYFINSLETRADAAKTIGKEAAGDLSNTN